MYNRQQHSKLVRNSLIMIYFFYILLAALTKGFYELFLPGWRAYQILIIPILLGYLGFSWGIFNLSHDPVVKWQTVKKVAYFNVAGVVSMLLSVAFIIFSELIDSTTASFVILMIGIALLIISPPLFSIGFFIFRGDLKQHYFDKYLTKFPNIYVCIAYLVQTVGLIVLLVASFLEGQIYTVMFISGLAINIASIIGLGVGFYPIFISFRTYPKILEILEEAHAKKQQGSSSQKTKKAS